MEHCRLIFLTLLLVFAGFTGNAAESLKLRSDLWCPYACEPGGSPGVVMEIVEKILGPKNFKLDYQLVNFARAVSDSRGGTYDGVIAAAKADAPDFIFPNEAQAAVSFEFFTLKSAPWKYHGSLENKKVAVINGYNYDDSIDRLIKAKDAHFVTVSGDDAPEQMVKMLESRRIDAVYEAPAVFKTTVAKLKLDESLFQSAGAPEQKPQLIYVAFSPKNKQAKTLAHEIDLGMKKLRKNGELKKIYEKYGLRSESR